MTVETGLRGEIYSACHATQGIGNLLPSYFLLHNGGFELTEIGWEQKIPNLEFTFVCVSDEQI